ncbi:putative mediator of RNA polymerase II transcription subunit 4 [Cladorrhinum sp. PSN332]|nr:putative mediator of RNA polymerase II transcription subunit 4 [Cladorrhinum sp. PSN332]
MNRPPKPDSMQKKLDGRFDRVEKALIAFVDSLTKNNPSERLAADLVEAERELHGLLKELETHQNNVAKIKSLKEETDALDLKTKNILQNLWDMRRELKAISTISTTDTQPKHQFTTAELLSFARRISRNTLPPTGVIKSLDPSSSTANPPPLPSPNPNNPPTQTPNASASLAATPSASTPAAATAGTNAPPTPSNVNGAPLPQQQKQQQQQQPKQPQPPPVTQQPSSIIPPLPAHLAPHLNPYEYKKFVPWPTMEQIRSGALMKVQDLVNRGIDPRNYDPEEEERKKKEEEQARKEADEKARQEREEHEQRAREEKERIMREQEGAKQAEAVEAAASGGAAGEAAPGGSISGPSAAVAPPPAGSAARPAPKQFQFLDDDDDDEEED